MTGVFADLVDGAIAGIGGAITFWFIVRYKFLKGNPMSSFISIHLPLNPTDEELRKAREHLALLRSSSASTDKTRGHDAVDESVTLDPRVQVPPVVTGSTVVPPPPATPSTVVTDSTGLPWDERIHSGSKAKNNNGSWKKRKGVQESEVTKIAAQIRATLPPPPAAPPVAPTPPAPETAFQQTVAPPAPPTAPPPPTAATGAPTFVSVLQKISARVTAGTLTQAKVAELCKSVGVVDTEGNGSLPLLSQNAAAIPTINTLIDAS